MGHNVNMVTALGRATADHHTLFGHGLTLAPSAAPVLRLAAGRPH
jgi:hypothetical protein